MRYSPLADRITGSGRGTWNVHAEAVRRRNAGEDIIFLTVGDPDQDPPEAVIEATVAALRAHRTGYSATIGYPAVREAIAARVARRTGQVCAADNVAVVPGAQGGLYCALQCLAGPGDEVYEDLAFARPHVSAWSLPGMADCTIVVSSLSKSHAIPAFRFGWVVGPRALSSHLSNLVLCMTYGSPAFIQDGALVALQRELPEVVALHEEYRARASLLTALLREAPGCRAVPPEGGRRHVRAARHPRHRARGRRLCRPVARARTGRGIAM